MSDHATNQAGILHHIELNVSDLNKTRVFWSWLLGKLGYSIFQEWDQGISFRFGPTYIVFVQAQPSQLEPHFDRRRVGLNHIAFHVGSRLAVDEFTAELRERAVPILYQDRHPYAGGPDHYAVFCEDPDRLKVEIVAPDAHE